MQDSKNEANQTIKKITVSIPVQATINVPVMVDVDIGDTEQAAYKTVGSFDFVDLEKMDNAEEIGKQLIEAGSKSPGVEDAIVYLRSAIDLHRKKHRDCKAVFSWAAGILPEEEI